MLNVKLIHGKNGKASLYNGRHAPKYENPEQWAGVCQGLFGCDDADVYSISGVAAEKVFYAEDIVSSAGAAFTLFQEPSHTASDIADAKRWLRNRRDVVHVYVLKVVWLDDTHPSIDEEKPDGVRCNGVHPD